MRISDWSSDVCSSDLFGAFENVRRRRIQNGFVQRLCLAGAARLSRKSAVPAAGAEPAFGSAGYVDDAQHGFAMVQQSKQRAPRSEEHKSELQSLMRSSEAVHGLTKKTTNDHTQP